MALSSRTRKDPEHLSSTIPHPITALSSKVPCSRRPLAHAQVITSSPSLHDRLDLAPQHDVKV